MPPRTNAKKQAGQERKAEQKAQKKAEEARKLEEQEAKEWQKGANTRGAARSEAQAAKADEAARKRREKAELLAAEEAEQGGTSKPKKTPALSKKKGKKKKDDLSLLEDALVSAADKKQKAKKREERLKQEKEAAAAKATASAKQNEEQPLDPLLANTEAMIGGAASEDGAFVGRQANKAAAGAESGIDAALDSLNVGGGAADMHPEKRVKALHRAFEEKMMPVVKEEYPGLRQTQYKEKIFQMWKKSPENPLNQQPPPS